MTENEFYLGSGQTGKYASLSGGKHFWSERIEHFKKDVTLIVMMTPVQRLLEIVKSNRYLTLSTCGAHESNPWVAPLAYYCDEWFNFYFYSEVNSRHCLEIAERPRVSFAIYDSSLSSDEVDGTQIIADAELINNKQTAEVVPKYFHQSFPNAKDRKRWERPATEFFDGKPQRFYKLTPREIFVIDLEQTTADRRLEIDKQTIISVDSAL